MSFEVFTRRYERPDKNGPQVRVKGPLVTISSSVAKWLKGHGDYFEFLVDSGSRTLGIRPVDQRAKHTFKCFRRGRSIQFTLATFVRASGLDDGVYEARFNEKLGIVEFRFADAIKRDKTA